MRPFLAVFLLMVASSAAAEPRTALLPQMPALQHVVRSSGMIFSGVVLLVQPSGSGAFQITFRVENAIRGVPRGQTVRISEWSARCRQNNGIRPPASHCRHRFLQVEPGTVCLQAPTTSSFQHRRTARFPSSLRSSTSQETCPRAKRCL